MSETRPPTIACRRMVEADIDAAIALLMRGFPERGASYWRCGLERMRDRSTPEGFPRFGYVLVANGELVGIIVLIFALDDRSAVRANVSSWYVEPHYRAYSGALLSAVLRLKNVTLFNISPAPTTYDTIEAQGFRRYVDGAFIAFTAFLRGPRDARIRRVRANDATAAPILRDHAGFGCLCYEIVDHDGPHPFVFQKIRAASRQLTCAQLVYCRDVADFVRFAGPLGRRLLARGASLIVLDAHEPPPGLAGKFVAHRNPKYYRGDAGPPRLGDLAYSEMAIFGP